MAITATLAKHAVEERVHHHVARLDPDLGEQSLCTLSGLAHKDATADGLVCGRILPEHQHLRGSVESTAVKNRTPFDSKVLQRVDVFFRVIRDEYVERSRIARAEAMCHFNSSGHQTERSSPSQLLPVADGAESPPQQETSTRPQGRRLASCPPL